MVSILIIMVKIMINYSLLVVAIISLAMLPMPNQASIKAFNREDQEDSLQQFKDRLVVLAFLCNEKKPLACNLLQQGHDLLEKISQPESQKACSDEYANLSRVISWYIQACLHR